MENLKELGKSESNIQIHHSFTHQINHDVEGIKHQSLKPEQKHERVPAFTVFPYRRNGKNQRQNYSCHDRKSPSRPAGLKLMN